MLRLNCPFCGMRDHNEFTYLEDGSIPKPEMSEVSHDAWLRAVFLRDNLRGKHTELWQHGNGCRMILRVERDTQTHLISKVEAAHPAYGKQLARSKHKKAHKPKKANVETSR